MTYGWIGGLVIALMAACGGGGQSSSAAEPEATAPGSEPAAAATCPTSVTEASASQGGACVEEAVLGADVVKACTDWFASQSWIRDGAAEAAIGSQSGKVLVCYHAP